MGQLHEMGIVAGKNGIASTLFESLFPDFMEVAYEKPSEYIKKYREALVKYIADHGITLAKATNGKIFEYMLATLFIREEIFPFYLEATLAFVPNVKFDFIIYSDERGPICISAKTSLRERYKQPELEAMAMKSVHRRSQTFLVSLDEKEVNNAKKKIIAGDLLALDDIILATGPEFDNLIKHLKDNHKLTEAGEIKIIESSRIISKARIEGLN